MKREIVGQGAVVVLVVAIVAAIVGGAIGYLLAPAAEVPPDIAELQAQISDLEGTVSTQQSKISELEGTVSDLEAQLAGVPPQQFKGMKVFWIGGASGCPFDALLMKGAMEAEEFLGVDVEYVHTEWLPEKMVARFKDAIAAKPDGIVVMGHPGYEGLAGLFEDAYDAGIAVTLANVYIPELYAKYTACGYVGQELYDAGYTIAKAGVTMLDLKAGDKAAVFSGSWDEPARAERARGSEAALLDAGLTVDRVEHASEAYGDPSLLVPVVTGYYAANPDVKAIVFDGGGSTAATTTLMEAIGVAPGEITVIGFDLSPATADAIQAGYLQLTLDQQPYLQGYMTVLNLCLSIKYEFAGLYMDTGGGVIGAHNIAAVLSLVEEGYR